MEKAAEEINSPVEAVCTEIDSVEVRSLHLIEQTENFSAASSNETTYMESLAGH